MAKFSSGREGIIRRNMEESPFKTIEVEGQVFKLGMNVTLKDPNYPTAIIIQIDRTKKQYLKVIDERRNEIDYVSVENLVLNARKKKGEVKI